MDYLLTISIAINIILVAIFIYYKLNIYCRNKNLLEDLTYIKSQKQLTKQLKETLMLEIIKKEFSLVFYILLK